MRNRACVGSWIVARIQGETVAGSERGLRDADLLTESLGIGRTLTGRYDTAGLEILVMKLPNRLRKQWSAYEQLCQEEDARKGAHGR